MSELGAKSSSLKQLMIVCAALFGLRCDTLVTADAQDDLSPLEYGIWKGTLEFTLDVGPLTKIQSGIVSFEFFDSTYKYVGEVQKNTLSVGVAPYKVSDGGPYKTTDSSITFADRAIELGAMWVPSLYLHGEHKYKLENDTLTFTRIDPSQSSAIVLKGK
ncbi:MAG: hypothetical protein HYY49_06815 [Ignavibacteriales bacterium]|nr:hypothetical protein [Ignavibacteriales bacterium]